MNAGLKVTLTIFLLLGGMRLVPGDETLEQYQDDIEYIRERMENVREDITEYQAEIRKIEEDYGEKKEQLDTYEKVTADLDAAREKARSIENSIRRKQAVLQAFDEGFTPNWKITPGRSFPKLVTRSGQAFERVTIHQLGGSGVKIKHSGGFADIPIHDLPDEAIAGTVFRPETEDISDVVPAVLAQRPVSLAKSDAFKEIVRAERADATAQARARREEEYSRYRADAAAKQRDRLAKRQNDLARKEEERQEQMKNNEELDRQIAALEAERDKLKVQRDTMEKNYRAQVANYRKTFSKAEEKERADAVQKFYDLNESYVERISLIDRKILQLQRQKKQVY